ncbi:MAG: hypothetical protein NC048_02715 [Bacteroides sp.]|nr:hypothetical protein [Bacteroides sp.]MCM1531448.1 hypothetical protein [Ruminococcus flavefaciens]MCM1554390.1 hypothetical protein [Bacteroides sp.]
MKRIPLLLALILPFAGFSQQVGFNADGTAHITPPATTAVDIRSAKKGILLPRLTARQKNLLKTDAVAAGLLIYQTDSIPGLYCFDGSRWQYLNPGLILSDTGQQLRFATVAVTGDYNDLDNRPTLPGNNTGGEAVSFAKVAYTGNYYDLENLPELPQALQGLKTVAVTGRYEDLEEKPLLPTSLAETEQDEFYRTVSDADKQRWNAMTERYLPSALRELEQDSAHRLLTATQAARYTAHANTDIPSKVGDFNTDDYYLYTTLAERQAWDTHAATPIPARLADLKQIYTALLVTDADIARWDRAAAMGHFSGSYNDLRNKPDIITALKDLKTDPEHQTLTQAEMEKYSNYASTGIKSSLSDYANSINVASGYYQLVSENDKLNWNTAAAYLEDTLCAAARKNDFSLLRNRPDYAEVIYTGDYNDLQDKPDFQRTFIENNRLSDLKNAPTSWPKLWLTCSLNDVPGHPDFAAVAYSGAYADLKNRPVTLADLQEDAQSVHISRIQKETYADIYNFYKGTGNYAEDRSPNDVVGNWEEPTLRLKGSAAFPAGLQLSSKTPAMPATPGTSNRIPTIGNLKAMDQAYQAAATSAYPEGTVLISSKALSDEMKTAGWCYFKELESRFPVAVNSGIDNGNAELSKYAPGITGGKASVTLTIDEMPSHRHKAYWSEHKGDAGSDLRCYGPVRDQAEYTSALNANRYTENYLEAVGGSQPHENRPPYKAVYFIIKSKTYCGY